MLVALKGEIRAHGFKSIIENGNKHIEQDEHNKHGIGGEHDRAEGRRGFRHIPKKITRMCKPSLFLDDQWKFVLFT